jgi:excinuclease ABC subunit C
MRRKDADAGVAELMVVLKLENRPRLIEAFDISNILGSFAVAGMVAAVDGIPSRRRYRRFRIRTVVGADDPAMMSEVIRRRYRDASAVGGELPGLVLVDGGATQLGSARAALDGIGLGRIPVAGLAKKYEELYVDAGCSPLRLPADSKGLCVLCRLRDEAHRFALDYHRRLRERRIRESRLDEIPGMGAKKKARLLAALGSVGNILKAGEKAVASVPGIGAGLARDLFAALGAGADPWAEDTSRRGGDKRHE